MPRHQTSMKDVVGCEKSRRVAKQTLTREFPNGETWPVLGGSPYTQPISVRRALGELKHLSNRGEESKSDSLSSGERTGNSPNHNPTGLWGCGLQYLCKTN